MLAAIAWPDRAYGSDWAMMPLIPNHAILVTVSDTVDLPCASSYLSVTNSGVQTLHLTMAGGEDITIHPTCTRG